MPTAMHWYNMAAQKFGGVDPTDEKAVEAFFVSDSSIMSKKMREDVVRFLLGHDGPARIPADCDCSSCEKTRNRG